MASRKIAIGRQIGKDVEFQQSAVVYGEIDTSGALRTFSLRFPGSRTEIPWPECSMFTVQLEEHLREFVADFESHIDKTRTFHELIIRYVSWQWPSYIERGKWNTSERESYERNIMSKALRRLRENSSRKRRVSFPEDIILGPGAGYSKATKVRKISSFSTSPLPDISASDSTMKSSQSIEKLSPNESTAGYPKREGPDVPNSLVNQTTPQLSDNAEGTKSKARSEVEASGHYSQEFETVPQSSADIEVTEPQYILASQEQEDTQEIEIVSQDSTDKNVTK